MEKIYLSAIGVLLFIMMVSGIYAYIRISSDSKRIETLETEKSQLIMRISSAESLIKVQNERIKQHAVDMVQAENVYMGKLADIEKKYNSLKSVKIDTGKCENILQAVYENQKRFLYER